MASKSTPASPSRWTSGQLQRTFDRMDGKSVNELETASRRVLDDLVEVGVDAYPCWGGLRGAVRDGRMMGHDSGVDLAWLSKHTHPFDIIGESRMAQREMRRGLERRAHVGDQRQSVGSAAR